MRRDYDLPGARSSRGRCRSPQTSRSRAPGHGSATFTERGEKQEALWFLIGDFGGEALDSPSGGAPGRVLACVLADVEVERPAVEFDDEEVSRPYEVSLDTGDLA